MTKQASPSTAKKPAKIREVEVSSEPIELYKILKFEGMTGSGGEAKGVIASGQVLLNGEVETQKRKKIVSGDIIEFAHEKIRIRVSGGKSIELGEKNKNGESDAVSDKAAGTKK